MAPADIETIATTSRGVAFKIEVKSPTGAKVMNPVRKRLEERAAQENPFPNLLSSERVAGSTELPVKTIRVAERARIANERKKVAVERARIEKETLAENHRSFLEEGLKRAEEKKRSSLAEKSSKAGKHFVNVKSKVGFVQLRVANAALGQEQKLFEAMEQKGANHEATVNEISDKAGRHNGLVVEKVEKHLQRMQERQNELRERSNLKALRTPVRVSREPVCRSDRPRKDGIESLIDREDGP